MALALCVLAFPAAARADSDGLEFEVALEPGAGMDGGPTQWIGGLLVGGRLRFHPRIPLGIEAETYLPWGAGGGLILDIYRHSVARLHADIGAFGFWGAAGRLAGKPGLAWGGKLGLGLEISFGDNALLLDTRAFLPDPSGWFSKTDAAGTLGAALERTQFFFGYGRRFF
jgi:hypothetical protein